MLAEKTTNASLSRLCPDRRVGRRVSDEVVVQTSFDGTVFTDVPVVECSAKGARVVLSDFPQPGDAAHIIVKNPLNTRKGMARVAWVNSLSNGRSIVGLEFRRLD